MGFDGIFNMLDILVLGFGLYAMYAAFVLKREGKIIRTFLVFKDTDLNSCRDLQGYANCMSPKLWTLGTVMVVYSGISLMNTYSPADDGSLSCGPFLVWAGSKEGHEKILLT